MQRGILTLTTRLKRYKVMSTTLKIVSLPIMLPLGIIHFVLNFAAEKLEDIIDFIDACIYDLKAFIVHKLNWNEIALKQRQNDPKKFK
jgi:hypothetical protein